MFVSCCCSAALKSLISSQGVRGFVCFLFCFSFIERIPQTNFKPTVLLVQPLKGWNCRCLLPSPALKASILFFNFIVIFKIIVCACVRACTQACGRHSPHVEPRGQLSELVLFRCGFKLPAHLSGVHGKPSYTLSHLPSLGFETGSLGAQAPFALTPQPRIS